MQDYFNGVKKIISEDSDILRRFGITSDIIAYKLCRRNYGYFKIRKYVPTASGQMFFGTIIHEVFDQAHLHFAKKINLGELKLRKKKKNFERFSPRRLLNKRMEKLIEDNFLEPKHLDSNFSFGNKVPTPLQLGSAFIRVENSLRAKGIVSLSGGLRMRAFELTQRFNLLLGEYVYPRIMDTEHNLEYIGSTPKNTKYMMHGVVDLVTGDGFDLKSKVDYEKCKIWDYKGGSKEKLEHAQKEYYNYQLLNYVKLFEKKNQVYPQEANLIFVGSLTQEKVKKLSDPEDILNLLVQKVEFDKKKKIDYAFNDFEETIDEITDEYEKDYEDQWRAYDPSDYTDYPTPSTMCETCELRWSCISPHAKYKLTAL